MYGLEIVMVPRKRAIELAMKHLYGQQRLFESDADHVFVDMNEIQEVLLDFGPELQAFYLLYPDDQVELLFFGEHDSFGL